jgi:hypothetical protein
MPLGNPLNNSQTNADAGEFVGAVQALKDAE